MDGRGSAWHTPTSHSCHSTDSIPQHQGREISVPGHNVELVFSGAITYYYPDLVTWRAHPGTPLVTDFLSNSYCNSRLTPTSGMMSAWCGTGHYNGLTKAWLKGGPQCPVLRRWFLSHLITDSRQPRHSLGDTRWLGNTILAWSPARRLWSPYTRQITITPFDLIH